jgi:putative flippase GtrA
MPIISSTWRSLGLFFRGSAGVIALNMTTGRVAGFVAAGVAGLAVDLIGLRLLVDAGVNELIARVVSLTLAVLTTYTLNRFFTFRSSATGAAIVREFLAYVVASVVGLIVNYALFAVVVMFTDAGPVVAALAASLAAMFLNFFSYTHLVFQERRR